MFESDWVEEGSRSSEKKISWKGKKYCYHYNIFGHLLFAW